MLQKHLGNTDITVSFTIFEHLCHCTMNLRAITLRKINLRNRKRQINPCKCHPVCQYTDVSQQGRQWLILMFDFSSHTTRAQGDVLKYQSPNQRQRKGNELATAWKNVPQLCDPTLVGDVCHRGPAVFFWAGVVSCGSSQRHCYIELAKALCMQSMQHAMCLIHHLYLLTCLLFAQESNQTCWYVCPHTLYVLQRFGH